MAKFVFQNTTKVYFGPEQLEYLPEEVRKYGEKVLLVYGGGSVKKTGLHGRITAMLENAGVKVVDFGGVEPNPRHTTVNRGAQICREKGIEAVLAVGGGSAIDCAKVIAATVCYEGGECWDLVKHKAPVKEALPVITVLTLAATGSEMNSGGVISNMETNEKIGLHDPLLRPKVSFLDPTVTFTVNAFQTACGSFDIMSHIFDAGYFCRGEKMAMLDGVMEAVLRTVVAYAPVACREPENYEARENLMWAASWALNDFLYNGVVQRTSCHSIEHELSAFYDITHGLGLAILTPRWMEYLLDETTAPDFKKFGVNVFGLDASLSDMDGAKAAIEALKKFLFEELGLTGTLTELGIDDRDFAKMAKKACRGDVLEGYRDLTPEDVEKIYRMCL